MLALMLQLPALHDVMMPEEFGEMEEGQHVHVTSKACRRFRRHACRRP